MRRAKLVGLALGLAFGLIAHGASAQAYPTRSIRLIVAQGAGGTADIMARIVGTRLSQRLGQSVVIENRTGAGGVIGTEAAAQAAPDGYTLYLSTSAPLGIIPNVRRVSYDPVTSFAHIIMAAKLPLVLTVNNAVPARTLEELVAYARANPNALNFASSGLGTVTQLSCEMLKAMTGISMEHIPFGGSAASTTALLGGQVQVACADSSIMEYVRTGQARALAVTTTERIALAPDVPTMQEAGISGYSAFAWLGFSAPAGTPQTILDRIASEVRAVLDEPQTREGLLARGIEPAAIVGTAFADYIRDEREAYRIVIERAGLRF